MKKRHPFTAVAVAILACFALLIACNRSRGQEDSQNPVESQPTPIATTSTGEQSPTKTPSQTLPDYYAIKRISINSDSGIIVINPGTKVSIKEQFKDGTYNITVEEYETIVDNTYLSNDSDLVQSARIKHNNALSENARKMDQKKLDMVEWEKRKQRELSSADAERRTEEDRKRGTYKTKVQGHIRTVGDNSTEMELQEKAAASIERDAKFEQSQKVSVEKNDLKQEISSLQSEIAALRNEQQAANRSNAKADRSTGSIWQRLRDKEAIMQTKQNRLEQLN